jgi:hypothetical protein
MGITKMRIEDIVKELKNGEQLVYNKSLKWVAIISESSSDEYSKTHRVFKMKDGDLEEIPFKNIRDQLVKTIMEKIDTDKLVKLVLAESFDTTTPNELFDVIERVLENKGEIKERPGCVELDIAGKPGRHMHFRIM